MVCAEGTSRISITWRALNARQQPPKTEHRKCLSPRASAVEKERIPNSCPSSFKRGHVIVQGLQQRNDVQDAIMIRNVCQPGALAVLFALLCASGTVAAGQGPFTLGRRLLYGDSDVSTLHHSTAVDHLDVEKTEEKNYIDKNMVAEMEATGVQNVFSEDEVADDFSHQMVSFTQMMGTAEMEVSEFLESGFILANLDSSFTGRVARALVLTRYTLYISLCLMVGALVTAMGMVLDRIVIGVLTKKFEITVGRKGKLTFLLIFGVLGMCCTYLLAYWFFQGPAWLPCSLIVILLVAMFLLHKSSKGKKWFEEMIECLYLIVAPKLFVWKYILAAIGKDKIAFPYDV